MELIYVIIQIEYSFLELFEEISSGRNVSKFRVYVFQLKSEIMSIFELAY